MKKSFVLVVLWLIVFLSGCECKNHCWGKEEIIKESSCTEDGVSRRYCTECEICEDKIIYSEGHDFEYETTKKMSSCTEDGISIHKCTKCGEEKEKTVPAGHSLVDNVCTKCNARVSDILPDEWYYITSNEVVKFQNADIYKSSPLSRGISFFVSYYPVCKECHICGIMKIAAVGPNTPLTETYLCNECNEITYVRFKVEY